MAIKRRSRKRARKHGFRWLLIPIVITFAMTGWLYRTEIADFATFQFKGIDFTRPVGETPTGGKITEVERKELEKILRNQ